MSPRRRPLPVLLLTSCLLAGCGGGDAAQGNPASATATAATTTAGATSGSAEESSTPPEGAEAPPFVADTGTDMAEASADARVTVSDIRLGRHDGFDRVVFEVGGTGTPGWEVGYVDQPTSQGSGDPVEVSGNAVLQVTLTGAGYPYDTGVEEYAGPDPLASGNTEVVTEVVFDATFEGTTVAFVGTRAEAPFRVYLLESPSRVVLEVADPA